MKEKEIEELYKTAIEKWGKTLQLNMVFEEAGELIFELIDNNLKLIDMNNLTNINIIEEIADLTIMIEQVIIMFDLKSVILRYLEEKPIVQTNIEPGTIIKKVAKLISSLSRFIRGRINLIYLATDIGNTISYLNEFITQNKLEAKVIILKNEKLLRLKKRLEAD